MRRKERKSGRREDQEKREVVDRLLLVLDNFKRAKAQIKLETKGEEKINNNYQSIYKRFIEIQNLPCAENLSQGTILFLQCWFNKFQQYRNRDLCLTGESSTGHYIPQLAKLMIEMNKRNKLLNLKGISMRYRCLDDPNDALNLLAIFDASMPNDAFSFLVILKPR
ncbi:unnamed protein product [Trifolium pratense]|uniref:Uncharacterized protein n=1 Tax=Trifolium pratense TaxID=57577 RepID=A0ACB0K3K3_TRIPR|nr:unnamed protein product [Trifolium pratense]